MYRHRKDTKIFRWTTFCVKLSLLPPMNSNRYFLALYPSLKISQMDSGFKIIPDIVIFMGRRGCRDVFWTMETDNYPQISIFPKQACIHKIINEPIDSNPQDDIYNLGEHPCQKASLCSLFKGSYTLEAAVIIPVTAVFFLTLLFFFRVLQIQTEVQEALNYASRKTACEAAAVSSQTGLLVSAEAYFRKELGTYSLPEKYIRGGKHAITMAKSDLSGNYINLQVNYYIKIPISFFEVKGVGICQKSKSHKWIGDRTDGKQSDYVYVTKHGTVYHRSRKCHYLDLSIKSADYAQISGMRNKNEHKYSACSGCVVKNYVSGKVYVTDYGTCYHSDLACSGLKRTIYLILLEETGGKRACGKCGANAEVR